ncbi:hypothetical protein B0H16DRAFT_1833847 [Mycena metata]|uniref:Uncharacterized protein n=1 Tax=Mycena metata TaxID=1033252 RepID=A0AAD7NC94_9AGAR|nr:hypothetical protein B0H16DRAFT_1833847 [Mycena metata]
MDQDPPPNDHKWDGSSRLAQETIERHVEAYERQRAGRLVGAADAVPRLVDLIAHRLAATTDAQAIEDTLNATPAVILQNNLSGWHGIPYSILRHVLRRTFPPGVKEGVEWSQTTLDEWIISNEKWLRNTDASQWQHGLVSLNDVEHIFPGSMSTPTSRIIPRPGKLPGFELLCEARPLQIGIQPSTTAFKRNFYRMSNGLLQNLDWSNVFVAGGIVLGTLMSKNGTQNQTDYWASSDMDIYLYGLSPQEANKKIQHVFDVFSANLPPGTRTFAVRNIKTITFYAKYPLRRIQIVLKLARSPRDVLLNFDLDICAMGWDGSNVWMLPRAARALETGCNVFTMNLIHGHHLSERRASQPQRIFKYASRGYGLRILPSYVSSLERAVVDTSAALAGDDNPPLPLDLSLVANETRLWIQDWTARSRPFPTLVLSPRALPGYSLSAFSMFMRHVALWETRQRGELAVKDDWGPGVFTYEEETDQAHRPPEAEYAWNARFTLQGFRAHITAFNMSEVHSWLDSDWNHRLQRHGVISGNEICDAVQHVVGAPTLELLLHSEFDVTLPVLLPCDFAVYANDLVSQAQASAGLKEIKLLEPAVPSHNYLGVPGKEEEGLFMWRIGSEIMWPQFDRRVDEVFEVLSAFRRVNADLRKGLQVQRLTAELSKRESRGEETEFEVFARWVGKRPPTVATARHHR